jgi:chorismate mutase
MSDLKELRQEINEIDEQIIRLIADRIKVCQKIGSEKKAKGLAIKDAKREKEVFAKIRQQATKFGLNPVQVEQIYHEIVNMCSSVQE